MGEEILPKQARPGDFMNISWADGGGHSVVFLGWEGNSLRFWASQKATNGLSDQVVKLSRVKEVKVVRLAHPEKVFELKTDAPVDTRVPGDPL